MGEIAYRFETPVYPGNIVYVNLVANYSCTNDCLFCSRPRTKEDIGKANIYEKKAASFLFLPKSPSVEEIMGSIEKVIKPDDEEVAIIGLGEPLIYLEKVVDVIGQVKDNYSVKIRVDTNGLVNCMYDNVVQKLEEIGLDEIRISLNAINEEEYNALCNPKFEDVWEQLIGFIKECDKSKIDTQVSFVVGFDEKRSKEEYVDFANSLGVENVILRDYVKSMK